MATFILTWNASDSVYPPDEYREDVAVTQAGDTIEGRWSVGSRRGGMARGDRVFLLRQVRERGIVGSGRLTTGDVVEDAHWDESDRTAHYVDIVWDTIVDIADRVTIEELLEAVPGHNWNYVLGSGQKVSSPADEELEELWWHHVPDVAPKRSPSTLVQPVPLESLRKTRYARPPQPSEVREAWKREAELSERFAARLRADGHECERYKIRSPGEKSALYTDLFDRTDNVLYEVKGTVRREDIRMAVGQLLDYSRHIPSEPNLAVLLPTRPSSDLLDLLDRHDITCVHESAQGVFETAVL
ncbi:hypothetical protein [Actinoplanes sp. NPDC051851]|uniref:hypothetical protein n=1 Tax=Actinoplanes sp. NPDC051851 TaxID=3154753 RepID=UPI0034251A70